MTREPSMLEANDVMVTDPVCVRPSMTIRDLARIFVDHEISGAPVVNHDGALVGVVSKTDLIRRCSDAASDFSPAHLIEILFEQGDDNSAPAPRADALICVGDFMTSDPVIVSRHTPVTSVAQIMFSRRIHRVIVVDGVYVPVGVITSLDLLGVFHHAHTDADAVESRADLPLRPRVRRNGNPRPVH